MHENCIYVISTSLCPPSTSPTSPSFIKIAHDSSLPIYQQKILFCLTSFVQQEHSEIYPCCLCITNLFLSGIGLYNTFTQQFIYSPIGGPLGYIWTEIITNEVGFGHPYLSHCRDLPISSVD